MNKKFIIALIVMMLLGLTLPTIIPKVTRMFNKGSSSASQITSEIKSHKGEINEIKNNSLLPSNIKDLMDKIFFFI